MIDPVAAMLLSAASFLDDATKSKTRATRAPAPKRVRSFLLAIFWSPNAGRIPPEKLEEPILSVYKWTKVNGFVVDVPGPGQFNLTKKGLAHLTSLDEDVASAVERGMFDKKAIRD